MYACRLAAEEIRERKKITVASLVGDARSMNTFSHAHSRDEQLLA